HRQSNQLTILKIVSGRSVNDQATGSRHSRDGAVAGWRDHWIVRVNRNKTGEIVGDPGHAGGAQQSAVASRVRNHNRLDVRGPGVPSSENIVLPAQRLQ